MSPSQTNCASCDVSLKYVDARSCSNPPVIEEHMREKTGFEGHIGDNDEVCMNFYKFHLSLTSRQLILKKERKPMFHLHCCVLVCQDSLSLLQL